MALRPGTLAVSLLGFLLAAPLIGSLPLPPDNDAGLHTDAPDIPGFGLPIEEGRFQGNLSRTYDTADAYTLHPPEKTLIRVGWDSALPVFVRLHGPGGNSTTFVRTTHGHLVGVAAHSARWNLSFSVSSTVEEMPEEHAYRFSVAYEPHDHFLELDGHGTVAQNWRISAPPGGFVRVQFDHGERTNPFDPGTQGTLLGDVRFRLPDGRCGIHRWFGDGSTSVLPFVETEGALLATEGLPHDVTIQAPPHAVPASPVLAGTRTLHGLESPDGDFAVDIAIANSQGKGHVGWVVWDDPADPAVTTPEVLTDTLGAHDMEGGPLIKVGPYVYGDDLTATLKMPGPEWTTIVTADGRKPGWNTLRALSRQPTQMDVTLPDGSVKVLQGEKFLWFDFAKEFRMDPEDASTDIPSGEWRFDLDHVDGWEHDVHRVFRASFPRPPHTVCPTFE